MSRPHASPWTVLVLVCLAQFMVVLDATITNVALPSIQSDLGMSNSGLQWIVNAYTLVFGGFLLLGGRAGDLIGRKRVFLAGVVVFTAASFLCGLAESDTWLILARGLQGLGAAFVSPAALSIVTTTFAEGAQRTKAMGVWAAIAVGGGAVGLVMGGVLVDALSWEWVFFVNVPVGIVAFCLSLLLVPESQDRASHKSFDFLGALAVTAGLIALVYGIVRSNVAGWGSVDVIALLVGAVALLVAFVVIETRSPEPLVRLGVFRVPTLRAANVAMLLVASGLFAMFFFNSLYVQRVLGYSALEAGLAFLPFTAGIVVGSGLSQALIPRLGAREVPLLGLVLGAVGMLLFLRLEPGGSYLSDLLPGILLSSLGMGLVFVPVTLIATSGVPHQDAGLASGLFNTSQQVGGSLGLAFLSTLATGRTDGVLDALGHEASKDEAAHALLDGFHVAYGTGAGLLAAAAVMLFVLLRRRDVRAVSHGESPAQAG
ncbi:MAG: DHA2 family efflux MFS transporter permease subunit [Thermoleophilia bacterium]|nr:DHA2 family efflux MFS transporter permease subunit [Thermoleophilia bacterium]